VTRALLGVGGWADVDVPLLVSFHAQASLCICIFQNFWARTTAIFVTRAPNQGLARARPVAA
jgi:hypothetical protein